MNLKFYRSAEPFKLECGEILPDLTIAYHTYGKLNKGKSNVVWICHALTANSDPVEWWPGMVGKGCIIDPEKHFIVCANIIGSCYGSTHPLSVNHITGKEYFSSFPLVTIRDMVNSHSLLACYLKIDKIKLLTGGSMGGHQVLEWSIMQPDLAENLLVIGTNAVHSPFGIAFNESQRLSIYADPSYFQNIPDGGRAGLKAARSIALISYRSYHAYHNTQKENLSGKLDDFKASGYQRYQGDKLVKRFNAYSYVTLTKAMDSHNVGRGRESVEKGLEKIKAKALCISIKSDMLFPTEEQKYLARCIPNSRYEMIDSVYGHDGFLLETKKITELINNHNLLP